MRYWFLKLRKNMKLTQKELADHLLVSQQLVSRIENGAVIRKNTAKIIASRLDICWEKFFETEE